MQKRNELGFRKCLEENGINLRWDLGNKRSYMESCKSYPDYYEELYAEYLPKNKNAKVLEIGCGWGWFLYYMDKKGYRNILGIDRDGHRLGVIRKFGVNKTKKADVFSFLKDKKNYYDLIISIYVLEHIPKDKMSGFLKLVRNSLKKGGRVVFAVPNMESPFNLRLRYLDFTHEVGFTVNSLLHNLYYANFDKLRVREELIMPKNKAKKTRYKKAVKFVRTLYDGLSVRPPIYLAERLICTGVKN